MLEMVKCEPRTLVVFESPHRLSAALAEMAAVWGDRRIAVARELTKMHEEVFRGTITQAIEHFRQARGEFTLVVEGSADVEKSALSADVEREIRHLYGLGMEAKEAISCLSVKSRVPKKDLYRMWLRLKSSEGRNENEEQQT